MSQKMAKGKQKVSSMFQDGRFQRTAQSIREIKMLTRKKLVKYPTYILHVLTYCTLFLWKMCIL